jgi:5'-phosphate synthase pdxT subunit
MTRGPTVGQTIGVLALQGAFAAHQLVFESLGQKTMQVRNVDDLGKVDALVFPGGESTSMSHLLRTSEMFKPIKSRLSEGMPAFGTCAGMIMLSASVIDGRQDQQSFGVIDIDVQRNAYGRQVDSFETDINVDGLDSPFHASFIRAPQVVRCGAGVTILAHHANSPILVKQESVMVAAFHPELGADNRIHAMFLEML